MTPAAPFLHVALAALDEAGDPTGDRQLLVDALAHARPLVSFHKPGTARKVVGWAATQMAMSAENPARAYSWLRELLRALLAPVLEARGVAPAPEVAMAMPAAELLELLAPSPRIVARELAVGMKLDIEALLAGAPTQRLLGIRAIPQASIGRYANVLAAMITSAEGELAAHLGREALAICVPAADGARTKVADALRPRLTADRAEVRVAAIAGLHGLRFRLDNAALLSALADPAYGVRAAAARTIGVGRRDYPTEVGDAVVALIGDAHAAPRLEALGAITRLPFLLSTALLEPLRACAARGGDEGKTAVFLLGRLGAQPNTAVIDPIALARTEAPAREEPRAYEIAVIKGGLAVVDRGTGKQLFALERATLVVFIPGRAEVAVLREDRRRAWQFERARIPDGARLGAIAIPPALTHGVPRKLAVAGGLATIWCDHADAPYRFHVKLGEPDVVLDDAPVLGREG